MKIKIRTANDNDFKTVIELDKKYVPYGSHYTIKQLKKNLSKFPEAVLVAESNGKIIGFIIGKIKGKKTIELESIAVGKEYRNKRIGTKLTREFILRVRKTKKYDYILSYTVKAARDARDIMKRLGFKTSAYVMRLELK